MKHVRLSFVCVLFQILRLFLSMECQRSLKVCLWLPTETDDQELDWLFKNVIYAPLSKANVVEGN